MKKFNILLASVAFAGASVFTSCDDKLDVENPNQQTTDIFGNSEADLKEAVIACYNHSRMEGSYARVGYCIDLCRGDEVWNAGQVWYLPFDDLNVPSTLDINEWSWREWYYTINVANYILSKVDGIGLSTDADSYKEIKGQALFFRALSYYNLAVYYQNLPLITDYSVYSSLQGVYCKSNTQEEVLDQVEADLTEAKDLLPSRSKGGEWAKGRATCGAAAGYLARTLMFRHKFAEANTVLKDIIGGKYGSYKLMANYGDNFREGAEFENNDESLFEIQYLDYGSQGTDDEWTPVNTSSNATQGHAVESNLAPAVFGGWADLAASPWLYQLFKAERTTKNELDPRLYWTLGSYEKEYDTYTDGRKNMMYNTAVPDTGIFVNTNNGGIPIVKHTAARENIYDKVVTGLHCGVNLRMLRYADILLLAAECENEVNGPNATAIGYINEVRQRAGLKDLDLAKFNSKDKLFEQIANVERPKELGCEFGRGIDIIRWGFFYKADRMEQLQMHGSFKMTNHYYTEIPSADEKGYKNSFSSWVVGHEYLPIPQSQLDANPNLGKNSANDGGSSNSKVYASHNYEIHPVVELD